MEVETFSVPPCLLPSFLLRPLGALPPRPCQTRWCVPEPGFQHNESWLPSQRNFQIEQRNLGRFVDVLVIISNSKLVFVVKPDKHNPRRGCRAWMFAAGLVTVAPQHQHSAVWEPVKDARSATTPPTPAPDL